MQPTFSSSRILLPVRPWFIFLSLIAAAVLNFLPTAHWPGMPDWTHNRKARTPTAYATKTAP